MFIKTELPYLVIIFLLPLFPCKYEFIFLYSWIKFQCLYVLYFHSSLGKSSFNKHGWMYKYLCSMSDFLGYIPRYIIAELCGISTFGFGESLHLIFLMVIKSSPCYPHQHRLYLDCLVITVQLGDGISEEFCLYFSYG